MDKNSTTGLAILLGLCVGVVIVYGVVLVAIAVHPWLVATFGLAGAITVEAIVAVNLHSLVGGD